MLDLPFEVRPAHEQSGDSSEADGLIALVGFAGASVVGTGSLRCSAPLACKISGRFLMTEFPGVNSEVLDAIGELGNMIIGNFKVAAEELLGPLALTIPTVIHGRNFSTRTLSGEEWVVVPVACGDDCMDVKVCVQEKPAVRRPLPANSSRAADLVLNT